MDERTNKLNKT